MINFDNSIVTTGDIKLFTFYQIVIGTTSKNIVHIVYRLVVFNY